jgi:REP-associated tyrosine transposase
MLYDPRFDHRRSIRLRHYDYRWPGSYFVTICSEGRRCVFGDVRDDAMFLNHDGQIVRDGWSQISARFPDVMIEASVVMPNHTHAIVTILSTQSVGAGSPRPIGSHPARKSDESPSGPTLGQIIAYYKWITTKQINELRGTPRKRVWQRNYFEHVIRNENAFETIGDYIHANPARWREDSLNPDQRDKSPRRSSK